MPQYYKKPTEAGTIAYAYHGQPTFTEKSDFRYPLEERAFFWDKYPSIASYGASSIGIVPTDATPCTREEFEAVKASALAAINALMDADTVEIGHKELQAA